MFAGVAWGAGPRRRAFARIELEDPVASRRPLDVPDVLLPRDLEAYSLAQSDEFVVFALGLSVPEAGALFAPLSQAEAGVAALLLEGKSNADIARARGTSVHTVANQVANIFKKLGVASRSELYALCAREAG
jgi:DNA-binding CsgD family transcriptional regulator